MPIFVFITVYTECLTKHQTTDLSITRILFPFHYILHYFSKDILSWVRLVQGEQMLYVETIPQVLSHQKKNPEQKWSVLIITDTNAMNAGP